MNKLIEQAMVSLADIFKRVDGIALDNQKKVLDAFIKNRIALRHFAPTSGYGYDDVGRDTLNKLFADVFGTEDAI
ncbi:MAG: methionine gamma-lyase family protein, partial [Clostridiales bacterium]|nr:methionine gamma-lyase family protein [Clostridiales bacterium]